MTYEMLGASSISALRAACDPFDLPSNSNNNGFNTTNYNGNNGVGNFPFKPLAMSFNPSPSPVRPHLTVAEQAELEFELRYRGNMIVDQQRKIQHLEEELKRTRDQMDMMNTQLNTYEQERQKERKKPQSRYWTPDEHQRFLEALTKYGHKDVKAISMHVSTRNATQVRTHAQKYFLRLERERRKKSDDDGKEKDNDLYNSSGDEMYNSDQSSSPMEELSPPTNISSPPHPALLQSQPQQPAPPTRRRRSTSLISPTMGKLAAQYQSAVLAELPSWSAEDYDQFSKGLLALIDKHDDITQICRAIQAGYLPHRSSEDVEVCYKQLHKVIKQKPAALITAPVGSPKRRRTSKPELPVGMSLIGEGPLPAMGSMPPISSSSNFTAFMSNMSGAPLPPPPQYVSNGLGTSANSSSVALLPFQPPQLGGFMNMGMNVRPLLDYNNMPSVQSLQINNMGMGMSNMTMMDIGSPNLPSNSSSSHQWNSLALSFDLHQNAPSLSLPQGAPLVSSLN
jgi:SHAQKYF class myb-like DNA-binding protein